MLKATYDVSLIDYEYPTCYVINGRKDYCKNLIVTYKED